MQLPDYFDVIDKPMDFGTVREKLDRGDYKKLEELEVASEFKLLIFILCFSRELLFLIFAAAIQIKLLL